jgi:hypothetical protein
VIRALILLSLFLSAVFVVLIGGFHAQPPRDLIRTNCDATSPCWQQFQPGVTSYEQTTSLFQNMGWSMDSPNCQVYMPTCQSFQWRNPQQQAQKAVANFNQGRIAVILFLTPNVTLGEMLLTFGMPSQTDEYADFDVQGKRFIVYRSLWSGLAAEVDIDCPMTFATLLQQPVHVITNPFQPVDPGVRLILDHNFRQPCLV